MRFNNLIIAAFAASLSLTSASSAYAFDGFPLTITDAAGIVHKFDTPPKIGCAWYGCFESMASLGEQTHAVGYITKENFKSKFNFPPTLSALPNVIVEDANSVEHWAAAEVDVIMKRIPVSDNSAALNDAAPVFYLHHPSYGESDKTGYQSFLKNLEFFGKLTGQAAKAEVAKARFDAVLANLSAKATDKTRNQSIAVIFGRDKEYRMIGKGNPFCAVVESIGLGKCLGEGAKTVEVNPEEFLKLDPDWIIYMGGRKSYKDRKDPVWGRLSAVKNNQVYDAEGNRYYCCSTRGLIQALQDFTHNVIDSDVPATGKLDDFIVEDSPLIVVAK